MFSRLASDDRLVEQLRGGSEAAFEAIFERHHRGVLAFCRHMLGSAEEAEDAVQQTFLAAYCDLLDSDKPIQLRPWLYTIARNRCLSVLRSPQRSAHSDAEPPATEQLSAVVERRQDLRELLADLSRLPDDQRAALVLAEVGGMPHEEIAAVLSCRRDKVKALVFQARTALIAGRTARETPCADIREQLANLTGSALRRRALRRHLQDCAGCRDYRDAVRTQRRELALVLPVVPSLTLKSGILAGAGVTAAGAGAGAGAAATGSLAAKALVAVALAGGGVAAVETAREPDRPAREGAARAPVVTDAVKRPAGTAIAPAAAPAPAASQPVQAVPVKAKKRRGPKTEKGPRGRANGREVAAKPDKRRGPKPKVEKVRPVTPKPKAEKRRGPVPKPKPSKARGAKPKLQRSGGAKPGSADSRGAGTSASERKSKARPDPPRAVRPQPAGLQ